MNGVDGDDVGIEGIVLVDGIEPVGHDGRVPVMAMNDVRPPIQMLETLQHRPAEKDEPVGVVRIHIEPLPVKVFGVLHHIDRNVRADGCLHQACRFRRVENGHIKGRHHLPELKPVGLDATIAGHSHTHIVAQGMDGLGQRASYISQAAGLGKGHHLCRQHQDIQRTVFAHVRDVLSRVFVFLPSRATAPPALCAPSGTALPPAARPDSSRGHPEPGPGCWPIPDRRPRVPC